MPKEWKNKYNSFNSDKGLLYSPWYQRIKEWKDNPDIELLPPVEASLDPIHTCNLLCNHCNAHKYLTNPPKDKMIRIPDDHLMKLVEELGVWGVKGCCFGGGGEPTMHTKLAEAMDYATEMGMQSSVATNGTLFTDKLISSMARNCRWVGVSVDSSTPETYTIGRKVNLFDKALSNMKKLVMKVKETNSKCDVSYKFLIFDYNQNEIYDACKLAKEIGVKDFHARPADMSHQGMGDFKDKAKSYDINIIKEQFEKCHELEDENFHVYTIVHKFDDTFKPIKNFGGCYAAPCCIQLCASGEIFLCPDQRHQYFYKLGNFYPNLSEIKEVWGNKKHYDLVFKTGKKACNTRCTFNPYCIQCEELFIKDNDPMCINFI
jgi:MoaA/NifB/PqqE/SkfB family radical SAM enzyme